MLAYQVCINVTALLAFLRWAVNHLCDSDAQLLGGGASNAAASMTKSIADTISKYYPTVGTTRPVEPRQPCPEQLEVANAHFFFFFFLKKKKKRPDLILCKR